MSELYNKIETLCKENGTDITKMCRELQIPRSPFSELKAGRSKSISNDKLKLVASYFNVTTDYLLGNDTDSNNIKAFDEHGEPLFIDDEVREIVNTLRTRPEMKILFSASKKATKEDIETAVRIIEALRNGGDNN